MDRATTNRNVEDVPQHRLMLRDGTFATANQDRMSNESAVDYQNSASWEAVYGKNQVFCPIETPCCEVVCVSGPDFYLAYVTFAIVSIPSIFLFGFTFPWLIREKGPGFIGLLVPCLISYILSVIFLALSAGRDPGIIPRARDPHNAYDRFTQAFRTKSAPKNQDVTISGFLIKLKWCTTCNVYRPVRTVHCSVCDNCIERFDHHCPWIGNCVGIRNYRYFFGFVVSTSLLAILAAISSILKLVFLIRKYADDLGSVSQALGAFWPDGWETVVVIVIILGFSWFLGGVLVYHTFLVASNQTTYEQLKGTYDGDHNPFNMGARANFIDMLTWPLRKPLFDWKDPKSKAVYEPRYMTQEDHEREDIVPQFGSSLVSQKDSSYSFDHHVRQHGLQNVDETDSLARFDSEASKSNRSQTVTPKTIINPIAMHAAPPPSPSDVEDTLEDINSSDFEIMSKTDLEKFERPISTQACAHCITCGKEECECEGKTVEREEQTDRERESDEEELETTCLERRIGAAARYFANSVFDGFGAWTLPEEKFE
eukprot:GHVP01056324.1.p2 GENE.GHVP01056324.1~~GHVP01056324.1.p2  ORF type:complete len:540 (+),score=85.40 GHVP01056324.1:2015-3634(+)